MKAFISYSSSDREFVLRLAQDLKSRGIEIWLDEWVIKVGDEIRQKIEHGISTYNYFIIVLSNRSVASTWVEKELNAAFMKEIESKEIVILPVKIDDCKVPILISGKKYADFTESYEEGIKALVKVLIPESIIFPKKISTNVVIVHDDLSFMRSLSYFLEGAGFTATETYDLEAALELVERYHPSAIIIEPWYIEREGYESTYLERIRNICPGIKVIGLTGIAPDIDTQKILDKLFDSLLYKPITSDELIQVLRGK